MEKTDSVPHNADDLDLLMQGLTESDLSEPTELMEVAADLMFDQTKKLVSTLVEYKELMMMYTCAMKEIRTKFDVLNTEFNVRYQRNPINSISTRLKRTSSIAEKLSRQDQEFSIESIEENLNDVAGVRVICSYIDDIYRIADALLKQDDVTLVGRKDYIANPKPNGYRSLHLIVKVPVFFAERKRDMKVEVQIRTIAMDFWASLEYQLKYKQDIPNHQEIIAQLKACAEVINTTDKRMLDIRHQIELAADIPTEDELLLEKLTRLDVTID